TDFADVERYGLMLAGEVVKVAARCSAPNYPLNGEQLAVLSTTYTLAVRDLPDPAPFQAAFDEAAAEAAAAKSDAERAGALRKQRMAEETLVLIARGTKSMP